MGYFDGLIDGNFKTDAEGKSVFYPWGVFGNGVVIDTEDNLKKLKLFLKRMYVVVLVAVIAIVVTLEFWVCLALFPVFLVWYFFAIRHQTKKFQKTTEKLRVSEAYKNSARSHNLTTLVVMEIGSIGFVTAGGFILYTSEDQTTGLMAIGFFGLCSIILAYMIAAKLKQRQKNL